MNGRIRVLVVDDSAFARKVLREVLATTSDIEVVGTARDGLEALEKIEQLKPDVITVDLVMPGLDGIGLLQALPREGGPRVIVVSIAGATSELGVQALEQGAIDLVQKPTALATDRLYELAAELTRKIRVAATARIARHEQPATAALSLPARQGSHSIVVVGTSTGGPQALTRLLRSLPAEFPVPIAVALHIPEGYTDALSRRLHAQCQIAVAEATQGMVLRPGLAVIAPGGSHLRLRRYDGTMRAHLTEESGRLHYVPSVDFLLESAVEVCGAGVLAVVLTGMGDDGSRGASLVRRAGGKVLTEAEASCVIYGMPRSVVEAGNSNEQAMIQDMGAALIRNL